MSRYEQKTAKRPAHNLEQIPDGIAAPPDAEHFVFSGGDSATLQSTTINAAVLPATAFSQPDGFFLSGSADGFAFDAPAANDIAAPSFNVPAGISATVTEIRVETAQSIPPATDAPSQWAAPRQTEITVTSLTVEAGPQGITAESAVQHVHVHDDSEVAPGADDLYPSAAAAAATSSQVNAPKPFVSIAQLSDYLLNGFWQYNSTIAHRWGASTITYNIEGLNTAEKFLAQSALNAWHEVANLNFVQTTGAANITYTHNGTMQAYEYDYYSGTGIISTAYVNISADWITTDGGAYDGKTGIDSYGYQTYIHETGHALGLGHQGPYNGSASYSTNATFANDTWQYSVMSYFGQQNYGGSSYRYVITPQMADIYAVQSVYGAASTRTGDTVYGFNTNAGAIYNFAAYSPATALTIYDSGGRDTLDASGYSNAQMLDLRAGNFSSVGGLTNNIGIMIGTLIEGVIGGGGNDTIIGNDAANTIRGNAGVDTMTGGNGADIFIFTSGSTGVSVGQRDRITDFVHGTDKIDLSGYDARPSTSGVIDLFDFLGTAAFNGIAGVLNYLFDGSRGVTVVQGDTNGDRAADFAVDLTGNLTLTYDDFIGTYAPTVVIETFGPIDLTQVGSRYYLYNSGGSGPTLKMSGADVLAGQIAGWAPISAETRTGGYQVAWKQTGVDQYSVWGTDTNGNYSTQILGAVSGSNYVLQTLETGFQHDLNGDGTIGSVLSATNVESNGGITLTEAGSRYYLLASGLGPTLKLSGSDFVAGQISGWSPIGAETKSGGGYEVAWKQAGVDQYSVWGTDSNGNYSSQVLDATSGSSSALQSLETRFQQDLNGDGTIGVVVTATVIEASGSINLTQVNSLYYLLSGGSGPSLKLGGSEFVAGQISGWSPIAAETKSGGGYQVAWKQTGVDQYSVWGTDSNGNYNSQVLNAMSGSNPALQSIETAFHQDLNGDGTIGAILSTSVIESSGPTSLTQIGSLYYLLSGGSGPSLKLGGSEFVAGQISGWSPIAAETKSGGGYQVAWKQTGVDQYSVWGTDSNGNYNSQVLNAMSGSNPALQSIETAFQQDLNGDGTTGVVMTTVESAGSIRLAQSGSHYYLLDGIGAGPSLKLGGSDFVAGQLGGWAPIAAETKSGGGYQVAWKQTGVDQYSVWGTDANGNYNAQILNATTGNDPQLKALEVSFQQDLNGDSVINAPLLAAVTADHAEAPAAPPPDDALAIHHQHLNDYLLS